MIFIRCKLITTVVICTMGTVYEWTRTRSHNYGDGAGSVHREGQKSHLCLKEYARTADLEHLSTEYKCDGTDFMI